MTSAVRTPDRTRSGLGSFPFARRYSGNHFCFLFLRLLRCFSSPGSPPRAMDSRGDAWGLPMRVSPFRHPRVTGYVPLTAAFRSLSRLSSALSAKASALCPSLLNLVWYRMHSVACPGMVCFLLSMQPHTVFHGCMALFPARFLFPFRVRLPRMSN